MNLAAIAFTQRGYRLALRLPCQSVARGFGADKTDLTAWTAQHFATADALLFVGATGIAVRAIAPHVRAKTTDPAVLVADEGGQFVIPLLSGHLGGANALAVQLAGLLGAQPVLTTATDGRGLWAVDSWAAAQNLAVMNPEQIKTVSAALLAGGRVGVWSRWPIAGTPPQNVFLCGRDAAMVVVDETPGGTLWLAPKNRVLGVGCKRGTTAEQLRAALGALPLRAEQIGQVASIDLKADEPGLAALARELRVPFVTYSAAQLAALPGQFSASDFVKKTTGVDNVCERAAAQSGPLRLAKTVFPGVTLAVAERPVVLSWEEN